MINHSPEAAADKQYDHLDGLGQFNATEIREMTDYETDGTNEDFSVEAITARAGGAIAIKGAGEAFWQEQNQKGGFNHAELVHNTPEQKAINAEGLAKVRAAKEAK
jgi:hypothetical protein